MKKRQKPVLLATLLILLIGGAVAMNMSANAKPGEEPQHSEEDDHGLGESRQVDNSKIGSTSAVMLQGDANAAPAPKRPLTPGDGLVRGKVGSTKPKPSDSATSSQWYVEGSGKPGKG